MWDSGDSDQGADSAELQTAGFLFVLSWHWLRRWDVSSYWEVASSVLKCTASVLRCALLSLLCKACPCWEAMESQGFSALTGRKYPLHPAPVTSEKKFAPETRVQLYTLTVEWDWCQYCYPVCIGMQLEMPVSVHVCVFVCVCSPTCSVHVSRYLSLCLLRDCWISFKCSIGSYRTIKLHWIGTCTSVVYWRLIECFKTLLYAFVQAQSIFTQYLKSTFEP